jgi:hypothetical protein
MNRVDSLRTHGCLDLEFAVLAQYAAMLPAASCRSEMSPERSWAPILFQFKLPAEAAAWLFARGLRGLGALHSG